MTFTLRQAVPEDAREISEILSRWIDETPWMPRIHTHDEDRAFGALLIERTEVTVASNGSLLGFMARRGPEIEALYVARARRSQGIGSTLIAHAKALSDRLELWTFQANSGARAFYDDHGFFEVDWTDGQGNDEELPDVRLRWRRARQ